ncbi:acyltransferase family protein [Pedobacter africanus]|uniref:Peptidoglycan/LPS O-acetylase OafA/YrhL, contains acyltransferase and SGNH-hydrolase domains n=1 Tax=Pedobacter africanus TaxID=151894 RepID=A0A1W2DFK2_9SPHI|nr:acyltransferase [Pedobacter africanus]SMC96215.1 Peptidoglycan/LPS O-acetylase OafA/YrhL, contains acyltransferase and SGNH-hydrolase domains [Pedobacter africanus]
MNQTTAKKNTRDGALDLLRFLAVIIVFFAHYTDTFNVSYQIVPENLKWAPVFRYGRVALLILFIISGYVITMTSINRSLKDFAIARLSRIYPLYWVSCLAAFILPRLVGHSYLEYSSFKVFLANLTMIPPFLGAPIINPVFYTLIVELLFYFFIGFIILFKLWKRVLVVIAMVLVYCAFHALDREAGLQNFFPSCAAGMLFYLLKKEAGTKWPLYILLIACLSITLVTGKMMALDLQDLFRDQIKFSYEIFCALVTLIYLVFYLITTNKINIRASAFTRILGEISYPFYLFHVYFLVFYWYLSNKVQADLLLFGLLFVILIVSWLLHIVIEKPLSRFANYILHTFFSFFNKKKQVTEV